MQPSAPRPLPEAITCLDTGFLQPEMAASYLVESAGRYAFIETGTALGVPGLLSELERMGATREQVDYIIPTHVHLDHAGGAGSLMAACPNARLVVHPRGARHMIDPSKLWAGATAVYGEEEMRHTYGEIVPVAEERVVEALDEFELDFNGRPLKFIDTPGTRQTPLLRLGRTEPRFLYRRYLWNVAAQFRHRQGGPSSTSPVRPPNSIPRPGMRPWSG